MKNTYPYGKIEIFISTTSTAEIRGQLSVPLNMSDDVITFVVKAGEPASIILGNEWKSEHVGSGYDNNGEHTRGP